MNCSYCLDTKFTDKNGNPKGEHKGLLIPCPLCNKDGKTETKLDIYLDAVIKDSNRLKIAWTVEFNGPDWDRNKVKLAADRILRMVISKGPIPVKAVSQRLEFHGAFPYESIMATFKAMGIPKDSYKITFDREAK